ncbi:hypothetical protein GGI20_005506 [Coemansia sp. BCRC 34301]|nr:hypothetical protein GGI20_005506 [Coemansia sp. BCRC 34301]
MAALGVRGRNILAQSLQRVEQSIERSQVSHSLFCALFRAWSHNPAACLTLCLLSQHYDIASELISVFGAQTTPHDLTVSFLVQLDKLVQLIESPVFTYLRLQLLDPLRNPALVRALYGLLMMLPQSSAFAILRNRLSTVAMLPIMASSAASTNRVGAGGEAGPPAAQQVHYHYHHHAHSTATFAHQPDVNSNGAGVSLLSSATGVAPADLGELMSLLTVLSAHPSPPPPLPAVSENTSGSRRTVPSAAALLQQIADLQQHVQTTESPVDDSDPGGGQTRISASDAMRLVDEYCAHLFHSQSAFDALSSWIDVQTRYAQTRILANIAPFADDMSARPGAVCASPSRVRPDYYYAWTRDSALVMNEIQNWTEMKRERRMALDHYAQFTRHVQSLGSLGAAKFHMNGSLFTGPWCNAQTDGPAIRALALIRVGGKMDLVRKDLDYVAGVWSQNKHCDIWEEERGLHFYTAMAQHSALLAGAKTELLLGNREASQRYQTAADGIASQVLPRFWNQANSRVGATVDWSGGLAAKASNLDAQVLLASLHFTEKGSVYSVDSAEIIATVLAILRRFEHLYEINRVATTEIGGVNVPIGVAAGRYPEDVYDGIGTSLGNPWSLITSALAEYHYRLALAYADMGSLAVSRELAALLQWTAPYVGRNADAIREVSGGRRLHGGLLAYLLAAGDLYMGRVARHTARDGTMTEQWNRRTGFGSGAVHLTWSYAAHTSAARARAQLVRIVY